MVRAMERLRKCASVMNLKFSQRKIHFLYIISQQFSIFREYRTAEQFRKFLQLRFLQPESATQISLSSLRFSVIKIKGEKGGISIHARVDKHPKFPPSSLSIYPIQTAQ